MNSKSDIILILRENKSRLFSAFPIKSMGLFGSVVRDDFRDDSDIDILIDFSAPVGIEFIDLADELENLLNRKVDLVSRNGVKPKYLERIKKDLMYV
ncbi:MAG: nucleotidyltransferase domain-containing protein [Bacteroidales bacterium]|nr:nucleotidyltransferase domain-containing protein [Bacteroidales bacterium]